MRVCPHTALYMWPHNTIYVPAYHYILQLIYVGAHTAGQLRFILRHTCGLILLYISYYYMWVLTLQGSFDSYCAIYVALYHYIYHTTICGCSHCRAASIHTALYMWPHTTVYVASYYYIILLHMWVRILRGGFDSCSRSLASPLCVCECMSVYSCVYICVSVSVSVSVPVPLCLCLCQWCVCAFVSVSVSVSVVCLRLCQWCACAFVSFCGVCMYLSCPFMQVFFMLLDVIVLELNHALITA
jgi:hypothetical protein